MQRGDGRWQVHIRHTDEDGRSRRYTAYGSTPKEARAKASAVRERLRANLPAAVGSLDGIRTLAVAPSFRGTHSSPRSRARLTQRLWTMIINRMTGSSD